MRNLLIVSLVAFFLCITACTSMRQGTGHVLQGMGNGLANHPRNNLSCVNNAGFINCQRY